MAKPVAVLISDIHFNMQTLDRASAALRHALDKATELHVPLIVAGDMHDTKANVRAECLLAMVSILSACETQVYILVGNHDRVNEKDPTSVLSVLGLIETVSVVSLSTMLPGKPLYLTPYSHVPNELRERLSGLAAGTTVIMHQGLNGSDSGEYFNDPTALDHKDVAHLRVISGHYHRRQTIDTGAGNKFDYIGNPFTLGYGEASHPEKGFQVLMGDGSLEFVPTKLAKHVILEVGADSLEADHLDLPEFTEQDHVWVKLHGKASALAQFSKADIAAQLRIKQDFRLDLIPDEQTTDASQLDETLSESDTLDELIDSLEGTGQERKEKLKNLWKLFKE